MTSMQYTPSAIPTMEPALLITNWETPKRPVAENRKFQRLTVNLCTALEAFPRMTIHCTGDVSSASEAVEQEDALRKHLEIVRSVSFHANGAIVRKIIRVVRMYVPKMSARLQKAVERVRVNTSEAEQSLMYVLEEQPSEEWLPDPPAPGTGLLGQEAIPFDSV